MTIESDTGERLRCVAEQTGQRVTELLLDCLSTPAVSLTGQQSLARAADALATLREVTEQAETALAEHLDQSRRYFQAELHPDTRRLLRKSARVTA